MTWGLIGDYTPPGCDFNRVIVNFTATSAGRQLDRLALLYLGDTEVWRTSTAEPRLAPGIIWTYWKDMTPYLSMWKTKQKVIFDLPNLIGKCRAPRPRPPSPGPPPGCPPVRDPMYVLIISSPHPPYSTTTNV